MHCQLCWPPMVNPREQQCRVANLAIANQSGRHLGTDTLVLMMAAALMRCGHPSVPDYPACLRDARTELGGESVRACDGNRIACLLRQSGNPCARFQEMVYNRLHLHATASAITSFMAVHQLTDVTVVAHAGMISEANQHAIEDAGFSFILGTCIPEEPYVRQWRREHPATTFPTGKPSLSLGPPPGRRKHAAAGTRSSTTSTVPIAAAARCGESMSRSPRPRRPSRERSRSSGARASFERPPPTNAGAHVYRGRPQQRRVTARGWPPGEQWHGFRARPCPGSAPWLGVIRLVWRRLWACMGSPSSSGAGFS